MPQANIWALRRREGHQYSISFSNTYKYTHTNTHTSTQHLASVFAHNFYISFSLALWYLTGNWISCAPVSHRVASRRAHLLAPPQPHMRLVVCYMHASDGNPFNCNASTNTHTSIHTSNAVTYMGVCWCVLMREVWHLRQRWHFAVTNIMEFAHYITMLLLSAAFVVVCVS